MAERKESKRVKDANQQKTLDEAARSRRLRKTLEALEQDNFHEDPHANLVAHSAPRFEDNKENKRRKRLKTEPFKLRCRKNFAALLEEEAQNFAEDRNYLTAQVPPPRYPARHFCAVCGFKSDYTCVQCGARYCSVKCYGVHKDTRCLKWTA